IVAAPASTTQRTSATGCAYRGSATLASLGAVVHHSKIGLGLAAIGLGCAKTPALALHVETSRSNCISESQIILHTPGSMPCWRIVFSTFRGCMSFYTARVKSRHHALFWTLPALPPKADKQEEARLSALCQKRTHAVQQRRPIRSSRRLGWRQAPHLTGLTCDAYV